MRVLSVVGARPQFVKAAPVSQELRTTHEEMLVHTGQHYDEALSDVFFDQLDIPEPDHHLDVGSGSHAEQTAGVMTRLEPVVREEAPDYVLVYGDTNSTLAAALVAAKLDVHLAHVEAGLRSANWSMPEEVNRVLTDHASDLLLAPTQTAVENLNHEGLTDGVYCTGDVMYDALLRVNEQAESVSTIVGDLDLEEGGYILATVHRAGNTDDPTRLQSIVSALEAIDRPVVLPAHPRTIDRLETYGLYEQAVEGIQVIEPVGYLDFVRLLDGADRVVTDSGGVQKEAFFLDTPCVTLREETEWVETVEAGWNVLVGADPDRIEAGLNREFHLVGKPQPYGDGSAAVRVREVLEHHVAQPTIRTSRSESHG